MQIDPYLLEHLSSNFSLFLLTITLSIVAGLLFRKNFKSLPAQTLKNSSACSIQYIIWISFLLILSKPYLEELVSFPFGLSFEQILGLLFTGFAFWVLWNWKSFYFKAALETEEISEKRSVLELFSKLSTALLVVMVIMTAMQILDVPLAAIYAFGGIGGLAISFAASDVIKNLFGGIVIHLNRYFTKGDWITSPNKNFSGVVIETGWYMTVIRTSTGRPLYIPNGLMTDAMIENQAHSPLRRIEMVIAVCYKNYPKLRGALQKLRKLVENHPAVDTSKSIQVHFTGFGDSSLNVSLSCFTRSTSPVDFKNDQEDLLFQIGDLLDEEGIEIAYPTQTLYLEKEV